MLIFVFCEIRKSPPSLAQGYRHAESLLQSQESQSLETPPFISQFHQSTEYFCICWQLGIPYLPQTRQRFRQNAHRDRTVAVGISTILQQPRCFLASSWIAWIGSSEMLAKYPVPRPPNRRQTHGPPTSFTTSSSSAPE